MSPERNFFPGPCINCEAEKYGYGRSIFCLRNAWAGEGSYPCGKAGPFFERIALGLTNSGFPSEEEIRTAAKRKIAKEGTPEGAENVINDPTLRDYWMEVGLKEIVKKRGIRANIFGWDMRKDGLLIEGKPYGVFYFDISGGRNRNGKRKIGVLILLEEEFLKEKNLFENYNPEGYVGDRKRWDKAWSSFWNRNRNRNKRKFPTQNWQEILQQEQFAREAEDLLWHLLTNEAG